MTNYQCITCHREIPSIDVRRRVRCPHCGSKILYKPRTTNITVEAV